MIEHSGEARTFERHELTAWRRYALSSLFAIALFGYPIVGGLVSILGVESRTLTVPFRIFVFSLSLLLFFRTGPFRFQWIPTTVFCFWGLYLLRLINDAFFAKLEGADFALQLFVLASVAPVLALWRNNWFDPLYLGWCSFVVACIGVIIGLFAATGVDNTLTGDTGRLTSEALNPVTLGLTAATAILCAAVLWRSLPKVLWLPTAASLVVMLYALTRAGSKGPAAALVVCLAVWIVARTVSRGLVATVRVAATLLVLGIAAIYWLPLLTGSQEFQDLPLVERTQRIFEDKSTTDRENMIDDSIAQIQDSPWIGSAYVELNSGFYPHNVVIEAGLAVGVPVALIFFVVLVACLYRAFLLLTFKNKNAVFGLLFIQALISSLLSNSLFGAVTLWTLLIIIAAVATQKPSEFRGRQP